jgi:beta propeller repeat protein
MKRFALVSLAALAVAGCDRDLVGPEDAALAPSVSLSAGSVVQLTSTSGTNPAISGNNLVYIRNDNQGNVYLRDISTGNETPIAVGPWQKSSPDISGNYVVWTDYRSGNYDVYLYNISTQRTTQLTNHPSHQYAAQIDGNRIVWKDNRDGSDMELYLYDLTTGDERRMTNHDYHVVRLSLSGDKVAWADGARNVYVSDLITGAATQIATKGDFPVLGGSRIAWLEDDFESHMEYAEYYTVYMRDIAPGSTARKIGGVVMLSGSPVAMSDNYIGWLAPADGTGYRNNLKLMDLTTGAVTDVTTGAIRTLSISGNRVVWTEIGRGDNAWGVPHIFAYEIPRAAPRNTAPELTSIGNKSVNEGSALSFTATANDAEGNTLSFSLDGAPSGASIDASTGAFSWTPPSGPATVTFKVVVSDGSLTDDEQITVTVHNVAPQVSAGADATVDPSSAFQLNASFTDPGADSWTCTVAWGDGTHTAVGACTPGTPITASHIYKVGTYTVRVTATETNAEAASGFDELVVTVQGGAPTSPGKPTSPGTPPRRP